MQFDNRMTTPKVGKRHETTVKMEEKPEANLPEKTVTKEQSQTPGLGGMNGNNKTPPGGNDKDKWRGAVLPPVDRFEYQCAHKSASELSANNKDSQLSQSKADTHTKEMGKT
jgi:hypothetical protein